MKRIGYGLPQSLLLRPERIHGGHRIRVDSHRSKSDGIAGPKTSDSDLQMDDDHKNSSGAIVPHGRDPHRSRAPEFYGFVAWTSTYLAFILYLLWALVPDEYIVRAGVEWYPSRCGFFSLYPFTKLK